MTKYDNITRTIVSPYPVIVTEELLVMEKLRQGQNIGISQYHNTIPFYNGDFQFLENNLEKLEKIDENAFDLDYDFQAGQSLDQRGVKTKNNLGEISVENKRLSIFLSKSNIQLPHNGIGTTESESQVSGNPTEDTNTRMRQIGQDMAQTDPARSEESNQEMNFIN